MNVSSIISPGERFSLLKEKRLLAKELNREALIADRQNQRAASVAAKKEEERKLKEAEGDFREKIEDPVDQRTKNLNYTLEECEKWEKKQKKRNEDGTKNMDALAASTYKKEIKGLKIDKEEYKKQKEENSTGKKIVDAINFVPSEESKKGLANRLKESNERKMKKRRRNEEDEGGFINEKNRQFNMKLNRQYN
ncbi:Pre-mRNA-splicing factor SYF2 [Spathaspora sp. JA1]|nr:Pre-mRNA-splicing factor SYF2 [Spathaspora sp. JA1]